MLRYIYLLCLIINFELVFCYSPIRSGKGRRGVGARVRRREYGSEDSPLTSIDVVGFMQKPEETEDFEPYMYESKRRHSKYDYLSLEQPASTRTRRRLRPELSEDPRRAGSTPAQPWLPSRHLARHPKRKCTFSLFPFFSHKNKTKSGPNAKHLKRKSHSVFKGKHERDPSILPGIQHKLISHERVQLTPDIRFEATTAKYMSPNGKKKMTRAKKCLPKMIHNSRQFFANHFKQDNETMGDKTTMKDSDRERVRNDNVSFEGNNEKEEYTGEENAKDIQLSMQQKEQQKVLQELENRLRESYHVLRNLFK